MNVQLTLRRSCLLAFAVTLSAIAPIPISAIAAPKPQLTLSRGELSAHEAENVPQLQVTQGIGVAITFSALNDQIDGEVDVSAPKYLRAQRLGVAAVRLVPKKKSDRPILVSVPMKSGRLFQFLVQVTKEEAQYSRVDIVPDQQTPVAVAALPPQQASLAPANPNLLPVPKIAPPPGRGGPSYAELPDPPPLPVAAAPAVLTQPVEIPVPEPNQPVAVASPSDGSQLADYLEAVLPGAIESGKIKSFSKKHLKVQKAIAALRFGGAQTLDEAAERAQIKPSVLRRLQKLGQR